MKTCTVCGHGIVANQADLGDCRQYECRPRCPLCWQPENACRAECPNHPPPEGTP